MQLMNYLNGLNGENHKAPLVNIHWLLRKIIIIYRDSRWMKSFSYHIRTNEKTRTSNLVTFRCRIQHQPIFEDKNQLIKNK